MALSLARRDRIGRTYAFLLWQEHLLAALRHTEGARRVLINYDALIDAPAATLSTVAATLGLAQPSPEALAAFAQDFLDPNLRHARFEAPPAGEVPPGVGALTALLEDAARTDPGLDQPATRAEIAALIAAYDPLRPLIAELGQMLRSRREVESEVERLGAENAELRRASAELAHAHALLEIERDRLAAENAATREPLPPPLPGLHAAANAA